jgi:glycosyltransferase involved in cell wall biosynthesis
LLLRGLAATGDASLKLIVAGDGPIRAELEALARRYGVAGQVRFLGAVAREELPDLYASADAFLMPSTTETQGLVLAEALAAGSYVIAADAGPNREVLAGAGIIVPPTAEAFAAALAAVPERPDGPAAATARRAAQRFTLDAQIDRVLELYASLGRPAQIA